VITLSVAHTKLAPGAVTVGPGHIYEYDVSKRASRAAFEALYLAQVPCMLLEAGFFTREGCMVPKQRACAGASLGVEMHFNSTAEGPRADYCEVIHHPASAAGKAAAEAVAAALGAGFMADKHKWPNHGARADASLFFLRSSFPGIIVEGMFGSNPEQAEFLESSGGPEAYGMLVAEGLKQWWSKRS